MLFVCFRHSVITNLYLEGPLDLVPVNNKTYCVVPENIHTPTTEGIGNSEGEGGQRPRKFQRGGGLYDRFSFQRSFDTIRISKILSYLQSRLSHEK